MATSLFHIIKTKKSPCLPPYPTHHSPTQSKPSHFLSSEPTRNSHCHCHCHCHHFWPTLPPLLPSPLSTTNSDTLHCFLPVLPHLPPYIWKKYKKKKKNSPIFEKSNRENLPTNERRSLSPPKMPEFLPLAGDLISQTHLTQLNGQTTSCGYQNQP